MTGTRLDGPRQNARGRYFGTAVIRGRSRRVSLRTTHPGLAHARWMALSLDPEAFIAAEKARRQAGVMLDAACAAYIGELRDVRRRKAAWVRRVSGVLDALRASVGAIAASAVTAEHVRTYLAGRPVEQSTLAVERAILHGLFAWLLARGMVRANPVTEIRAPKVPREREDRRHYPPPSALGRLTFEAESDAEFLRAYVRVLAACGLRVSEADALRPEHVHPDAVHVAERKGGVGGSVPLPDERTHAAALVVAEANARGVRPPYERVLRAFGRECERAGIGRYTLHSLRHGCISRWVNVDRVPISVAQAWAGHSSPRMTERYLHADASQAPRPRALEW